MSTAHERDDLLDKRVKQFARMLHGLDQGDTRALHRTRVATRRLRELLPVLALHPDVGAKVGRRLRKVTEVLGPVRELDVLMQMLDELRASDAYSPAALDLIAAGVDKERKARRRQLAKRLPIGGLHRLVKKLERIVGDLRSSGASKRQTPVARGWRWAVDARVAKRAARLRIAIEETGAVYIPERLHGVRIALKKLRYALESASEAGGAAFRADLRALKVRQDCLGRLHDLQRLIDRARQVQASLAPPSLASWRGLEGIVDGLEDDCRRLHGRYMRNREPLLALCARLAGHGRAPLARRVTA